MQVMSGNRNLIMKSYQIDITGQCKTWKRSDDAFHCGSNPPGVIFFVFFLFYHFQFQLDNLANHIIIQNKYEK